MRIFSTDWYVQALFIRQILLNIWFFLNNLFQIPEPCEFFSLIYLAVVQSIGTGNVSAKVQGSNENKQDFVSQNRIWIEISESDPNEWIQSIGIGTCWKGYFNFQDTYQ